MTKERQQDLLMAALVISVLLHVGIMLFVRAKVMTRVVGQGLHAQRREAMRVTDYKPTDDPIRMERIKDIMAVKDAPEATSDKVLKPAERALPDVGQHWKEGLPTPQIPDPGRIAEIADQPAEIETASYSLSDSAPSVTPPIELSLPAGRTIAAAPQNDPTAPTLPANWGSPDVKAEMPAPDGVELLDAGKFGRSGTPRPEFVPATEVYEEVDEKIVEAEKAAVRDLMENDAAELEKFVNVSAVRSRADGWTYFKLMVTPRAALPVVPKDVVILLDASGSIGSERLVSCRTAAKRILRSCMNTGDRFNLVAFRNRYSYAFPGWRACDRVSFDAADKWLSNLTAHGRTDVFGTIRSVLTLPRDPKRPLIALVVTDGEANTGVRATAEILSKFTALNDGLVSVYMYGVKGGANRELIDVLTHGNRGESFVYGGARWSAGSKIETLSERFRDPVLSDIRAVFTAASRAETYPRGLKNLYRGDTLEISGRVPQGIQTVTFSLSGLNGPKAYSGIFKVSLDTAPEDATAVRLFADESAIDVKLR
jgi:hypothetical protein